MGLPPHEVLTIVRSTGLEPLGRPVRQGPVYVTRALDASGGEVRVIVNAELGRVVRIVPVTMPRYGVPVVRPPGRIAMAPDGGPGVRVPGADGFGGPPPAALGTAPHDSSATATPPLPRPRPKLAESDIERTTGAAQTPSATQGVPETTGTATRRPRPAPPAPAVEMLE
jgi:hypothetical protein